MTAPSTSDRQHHLTALYEAFNRRDVEAVLARLTPDVQWPSGWEGGTVHGRQAVRDSWTRQWAQIDPAVVPVGFDLQADGRIAVVVHQVVRDLAGTALTDRIVTHVYRFDGDLVAEMEIRD